ncbi:MAG: recombinase family protein [bacterium]|nr:recombinase family protein [bacterium]
MNDKIRDDHLRRAAYVYVRQSSQHQVRHHRESGRRQYDLAERARQLGFASTIVIDEDQGKSGSGLQDRPGFGRLLAAVCRGEVGAVLALEASRLSRNNRDWYHLIDLCALTETLIIDVESIYEPRELNDRLLLGLKGSMAEFELGLLRQRAREAFEQKIRRGHAMWEMPVGLVRNEEDRIEKIPDRQVQRALEGVFRKFRELGSARQTTLWYRDEKIPLPEVRPGTKGHEVVWRLPAAHRINQILKNPSYAGALTYGRTKEKTIVVDGRARKTTTRQRKPQDQWKVLLLDNHPGYLTWDEYLENSRILESNRSVRGGTTRGAARRGSALLAGLLRCGRCGRKLFVAYSGKGGRVSRYGCSGGRTDRGHSACLTVGGVSIERAVEEQVLAAIQPAGVKAALSALEHLGEARLEKRHSLELALEKAHYEVRRAQRQYDAVDPDNRLVAGELEARWNEALSNVSRIEDELTALDRVRHDLTDEDKQRLFQLGNDLPALWRHPGASNELKKRILRTVMHEIVIDNNDDQRRHVLQLHWKGGVHTELRPRYNGTGQRRVRTEKSSIELIRELSKVCSDQAIAATLNRLGHRTGAGKTWRVHSVRSTRYYYRLPNHRNGKEWLTADEASKELRVSRTVVYRLIREDTLPATQVVESTPWIINREHLSLAAVQLEVQAVHEGRALPRNDPNQAEIAYK